MNGSEDKALLRQAIELGRLCTPSGGAYSVGAVITTRDGRRFTGYSRESGPANHAEEEAIAKAVAAGADLSGATIYSSLEPCSTRRSKPRSCSRLILDHGFGRVVFAMYEPVHFVDCRGAEMLREAGLDVTVIKELAPEVEAVNAHILKSGK
ncbi:MAG: hypothetical protein IJC16_04075 [Rikenellaceae bacterium]|nr:hypothetical protein [Rikenellaceae bacterium]